mgnify:CR=1 FL=1|jgi:hypothetical protein
MKIEGIIIKKTELKTGIGKNGKEWRVQEAIIERPQEEYNKIISVEAFGDKVDKLDKFDIGETITIFANVYSQEYNGKYYNKIRGWFFGNKDLSDQIPTNVLNNSEDDDLPF